MWYNIASANGQDQAGGYCDERAGLMTPAAIEKAQAMARECVRRQGFWNQELLKLRECLAHLVGFIMRRVVCDASVAFRVSFV